MILGLYFGIVGGKNTAQIKTSAQVSKDLRTPIVAELFEDSV